MARARRRGAGHARHEAGWTTLEASIDARRAAACASSTRASSARAEPRSAPPRRSRPLPPPAGRRRFSRSGIGFSGRVSIRDVIHNHNLYLTLPPIRRYQLLGPGGIGNAAAELGGETGALRSRKVDGAMADALRDAEARAAATDRRLVGVEARAVGAEARAALVEGQLALQQ